MFGPKNIYIYTMFTLKILIPAYSGADLGILAS